jgi:two-component sensor histidine kinase
VTDRTENVQEGREWNRFVSALHHRLKNNLQTITSVIGVQANRVTDPKVAMALRAVQNRVRAIAGVFGTDSTDDLATVHFGDYLKALVYELAADYGMSDRVKIQVSTADVAVDMDEAIALALIANELLANALEHAFPGSAGGEISVRLGYRSPAAERPEGLAAGILEIRDDGVPLPATWDAKEAETTGLFLVRTLTAQLAATLSVEQGALGKTFLLEFPLEG